jgi:hypothetical protein
VDKLLRTAALAEAQTENQTKNTTSMDALQYRPNIENLQMSSEEDEGEESNEENVNESESEIEEDDEDSDA